MNPEATETGAFNTQEHETWRAPATLSEQINLPCNYAGEIDNWPAFRLVTTGAWPEGGEIDVVVGAVVSGFSGCGTHTYRVNWTTSAITFCYDGRQVGKVTPAEIGVPIAPGPMYVINDYAASPTYGGLTTGNATMQVLNFTS
jgi:hypothetical protein